MSILRDKLAEHVDKVIRMYTRGPDLVAAVPEEEDARYALLCAGDHALHVLLRPEYSE